MVIESIEVNKMYEAANFSNRFKKNVKFWITIEEKFVYQRRLVVFSFAVPYRMDPFTG